MRTEGQSHLREVSERYALSRAQEKTLAGLLQILERRGRAPTAIRGQAVAVDRHISDSLVALEVELLRDAATIADVGSGAGFPGLPLSVALPASELTLIESQARWAAFLEAAIRELAIAHARVVHARVEELGAGRARYDAVVARAVGPQPVVLEYAAPLLRLHGVLVDWRGRRDEAEEAAALAAAEQLGLRRLEVRRVHPFPGARDRHLHLYLKVLETPSGFPRRPGVARRRPLTGS